MAWGSYLGGGTIISRRSLWIEEARRRAEDGLTVVSKTPKGKRLKAAKSQASLTDAPTSLANRRFAVPRPSAASKVAAAPDLTRLTARLPKALQDRARELRAAVAAGVLLPTGKASPKHPNNRKQKNDR